MLPLAVGKIPPIGLRVRHLLGLVALVTHQDILGNGWAAAGMLRVVQTMNNSIYAPELVEQSANLTSWINEILDGVWMYQVRYAFGSL